MREKRKRTRSVTKAVNQERSSGAQGDIGSKIEWYLTALERVHHAEYVPISSDNTKLYQIWYYAVGYECNLLMGVPIIMHAFT